MGWGDKEKIRELQQQVRQLEVRVNDLERGGSIGEVERKQLLGETTEVKNELKEVTGHVGQISEKVAHIAGRLEGRGSTVNVTTSHSSGDGAQINQGQNVNAERHDG